MRRVEFRGARPAVVVVGDLLLDIAVATHAPLMLGSDVTGSVLLRQGGSAAAVARRLAGLRVQVRLITAVGEDELGQTLVSWLSDRGVEVHARRLRRIPTGRVAVRVEEAGERSFVVNRGAACHLTPRQVPARCFGGTDAVHLPLYSLICEPLASAARRAAALGRKESALLSLDLSSSAELRTYGRDRVLDLIRDLRPDVVFGNESEIQALLGERGADLAARLAPVVAVKRGRAGSRVVLGVQAAIDVPTIPRDVLDTTGAGDAFAAGFLARWLRSGGRRSRAALRAAAAAGNRAAAAALIEQVEDIFGPRLRRD